MVGLLSLTLASAFQGKMNIIFFKQKINYLIKDLGSLIFTVNNNDIRTYGD